LLEPALVNFWYPVFIGVLLAQAVLHIAVFAVGRWTMPLFAVFAGLGIAFAGPLVWLALNGTLVNPAFAAQVGYPPLAEGDAPAMLAIAVVTTLVTGWELVSAFLRARGSQPLSSFFRTARRSA
jgi:hypothetical protein